jgi:hypothetical protein
MMSAAAQKNSSLQQSLRKATIGDMYIFDYIYNQALGDEDKFQYYSCRLPEKAAPIFSIIETARFEIDDRRVCHHEALYKMGLISGDALAVASFFVRSRSLRDKKNPPYLTVIKNGIEFIALEIDVQIQFRQEALYTQLRGCIAAHDLGFANIGSIAEFIQTAPDEFEKSGLSIEKVLQVGGISAKKLSQKGYHELLALLPEIRFVQEEMAIKDAIKAGFLPEIVEGMRSAIELETQHNDVAEATLTPVIFKASESLRTRARRLVAPTPA